MAEYEVGNIVVLEGLDPVRLRPGMYIGGADARGLHEMVMEVIGNAFDEVLSGRARAISVDVDDDGWVTVADDGRGIPVSRHGDASFLELVFTTLSRRATVDGHHPHVHLRAGAFGIGLGPVSALSERVEVESRVGGTAWRAAFERGKCVEPLRAHGIATSGGSTVRFLPDVEIFKDVRLDREKLTERLHELAWLTPSATLHFQSESLTKPAGLEKWLLEESNDVVALVSNKRLVDDMYIDLAVAWSPSRKEQFSRLFLNYSNCARGTHEQGFITALRDSAANLKLWNSAKHGFLFALHLTMLHPRFDGPTKSVLHSEEARPAVAETLRDALLQAPSFWDEVRRSLHTANSK